MIGGAGFSQYFFARAFIHFAGNVRVNSQATRSSRRAINPSAIRRVALEFFHHGTS
jgi:hypothetical protein